MGRYYRGASEGKFWFAVQQSDDADYFGVEGEQPRLLEYWYDDDDLPKVKHGIKKCKKSLGKYKKYLDEVFDDRDSYNEQMLADFLKDKTNKIYTEKGVLRYLRWYARLGLGQQIHDCIKERGQCHFDAELY